MALQLLKSKKFGILASNNILVSVKSLLADKTLNGFNLKILQSKTLQGY